MQGSHYKKQREVDMSLKKGIVIGIIVTVLICLLGAPQMVWAQMEAKPSGTEIMYDIIVVRPLGMVGLTLGTALFIVAFPFLLVTGSAEDGADALVNEPFNFTFVRGMGQY